MAPRIAWCPGQWQNFGVAVELFSRMGAITSPLGFSQLRKRLGEPGAPLSTNPQTLNISGMISSEESAEVTASGTHCRKESFCLMLDGFFAETRRDDFVPTRSRCSYLAQHDWGKSNH